MEMRIPEDCGNSPRMAIVAELTRAWAAGEDGAVRERLADDARWVLAGGDEDRPSPEPGAKDGDVGGTEKVTAIVPPPFAADHGEILTVLNHGRLAACDGYVVRGEQRVDFCHVLRFAGAARTARIREIRTYLQPAPSSD